ncbi:chitin-binding protein [Paenibacillus shirakamiensis]|uniref:Chitin-binding protein n=1 Tax=Paenibacillus shirakamiensis TaxID=1265935 RepID=A0ABS4JJR9_9BACL|nr:lytic polysaccharide monooxygenase [Paenibacillus shirakamiensis]MBP2001355.1 chitin-binding protein [Paenibacillus shirakamiensis]
MTITRSAHPLHPKVLFTAGAVLFLSLLMMLFAGKASAHGYIDNPSSRAALCASGVNKNCGAIIYEPQSLEAPKGFPNAGPADGKIASAAGAFPELDQQTATRWSKVNVSPGTTTFHWTIEANHATTSWKYYITKQNWDPNAPLSRSQFDLTPFCSVDYKGKQPPKSYSDTCTVPSRTGYQVILAVWEISDTANAFYNVIDANFGGASSADTTAPTAPTSLSSSNVTSSGATLTWAASTDNVGVTAYKIYNGSTLFGTTTSGNTLSYNVTGLNANTAYTLTVKAVDAAGNTSSASNSASFTTTGGTTNPGDTTAPTAPGNLSSSNVTSSGVTLTWSAASDNVGVTGYRVYNGSTLVTTTSASTLTYTVSGLTASTGYNFTVKAIDAAGNASASSNTAAVTTIAGSGSTVSAWAPNVSYAAGALVTYGGKTYKALQPHTSINGWEPSNVPALWQLVS